MQACMSNVLIIPWLFIKKTRPVFWLSAKIIQGPNADVVERVPSSGLFKIRGLIRLPSELKKLTFLSVRPLPKYTYSCPVVLSSNTPEKRLLGKVGFKYTGLFVLTLKDLDYKKEIKQPNLICLGSVV